MFSSNTQPEDGQATVPSERCGAIAHQIQRRNHVWLAELTGLVGREIQQVAHEDLANYLFVVVQNHLLNRQPAFAWLSNLAREEVAALAEDMVQVCLEKLSRDDFALLAQFSGRGTFTSWTAQIALNETRSELRRVRWSRLQSLDECASPIAVEVADPEQVLCNQELLSTLYCCLDRLPEHYRAVLVRCVMNGERIADVAQDLKRSSQAVYGLIYRAKKALALMLAQENVGLAELTVFADRNSASWT